MDAAYLITGKESPNDRFGTGFIVWKDETAAWLATCAHVMKNIGEGHILLAGAHRAEVDKTSDAEDVALLRIDEPLDAEPLPLFVGAKSGDRVRLVGHYASAGQHHEKEITGRLGASSHVKTPGMDRRVRAWEFIAEEGGKLEQGFSGGPVIHEATGHVVGIATRSVGKGERGGVVSIQALEYLDPAFEQRMVADDQFAAPLTENDELPEPVRAYCRKASSLYETLPMAGFKGNFKVPIRIRDIYVSLGAMIHFLPGGDACFADADHAEACLKGHGIRDEITLLAAFAVAEEKDCRGLVILGDPGSGKTTHLKRVLLYCIRRGPRLIGLPPDMVPVFLPLRELGDGEKDLAGFIRSQLGKTELGTSESFGKDMLARGNLLFLFDGLDEVADPKQRERVSRWIEAAMNSASDCRFVVTSRFAGYTAKARLGAGFLEMHIRPLSKTQADDFVRNWYGLVERWRSGDPAQAAIRAEENAGDLIHRLEAPEFRSARVFELTRNPLLLTNICLIHMDRGNLPHTRVSLYEVCTEILLQLWREAAGIQVSLPAKKSIKVLQKAAHWMHQEERRTRATASELAPVIKPALKSVGWGGGEAADFLRAIRDESGILTGWDQEHYGFMHLGFQEYLTAREIRGRFQQEMNETGRSNRLAELAARFGESWWQEVALLLLALDDPPLFVPFMREVLNRADVAEHGEFLDMCIEDAAEFSAGPFVELVMQNAVPPVSFMSRLKSMFGGAPARDGADEALWERQLLALKVLERIDPTVLEPLKEKLLAHPFEKIRRWMGAAEDQADQRVIRADRGGYELVWIPEGRFLMGSPEDEPKRTKAESPQHEVTVPSFYMGRYPVTNEEYGVFLKDNSGVSEPEYWGDRRFNQPEQPVVGVSWEDVRAYAEWAGLRLPSEVEWEYACRAGTTTVYCWGDRPDCGMANYGNSSFVEECKEENPGKTSSVGSYPPNPWGLYDMHGNVFEWCEDDWHDSYKGAPEDGGPWIDSPKRGDDRVVRGGSWGYDAGGCRSAFRGRLSPGVRDFNLGFRLSRSCP